MSEQNTAEVSQALVLKDVPAEMLARLQEPMPTKGHISKIVFDQRLAEAGEGVDYIKFWKDSGQPHVWHPVEEKDGYTVLLDTAHGNLALFADGEFIKKGKNIILTDDCAVLDRDYYNTAKYIWR